MLHVYIVATSSHLQGSDGNVAAAMNEHGEAHTEEARLQLDDAVPSCRSGVCT